MTRSVSDALKRAAFAAETEEVFIVLLTIAHAEMEEPFRLSSDAVDTVSRGNTYYAFPFGLQLPDDSDEGPPKAKITVDNIDRNIVAAIRSISTWPSVTLEVVLASDPDVVEASFEDFQMREITYNSLVVEGTLSMEALLQEPYPAGTFNPSQFPGLF